MSHVPLCQQWAAPRQRAGPAAGGGGGQRGLLRHEAWGQPELLRHEAAPRRAAAAAASPPTPQLLRVRGGPASGVGAAGLLHRGEVNLARHYVML